MNTEIKSFANCEDVIKKEFTKLCQMKRASQKMYKYAVDKSTINASEIIFPGLMQKFIATKEPTSKTMLNFWRMIQDTEVKTIVMLTCLENSGVNLKAKYLPTKENLVLNFINGLSLELLHTSIHEFYEKR